MRGLIAEEEYGVEEEEEEGRGGERGEFIDNEMEEVEQEEEEFI